MTIVINIENNSGSDEVPDPSSMRCWLTAALPDNKSNTEINVQLINEQTMTELNGRFRHKPYPTNVLSFPAELPEELQLPLLGDIAICAQVVNREAEEQAKQADAHWAHMLVHGALHLLGYDHLTDSDADEMESLETQILTSLGFPEPYEFALSDSMQIATPEMTTPSCEK